MVNKVEVVLLHLQANEMDLIMLRTSIGSETIENSVISASYLYPISGPQKCRNLLAKNMFWCVYVKKSIKTMTILKADV